MLHRLLKRAMLGCISLLATPAFANFPMVSGSVACKSGHQKVTWTVTNSESTDGTNRSMTLEAVSVSQGSVSGLSVGQVLPPQPLAGSTVTGTTMLSGTSTGSVTLTVTGHFYESDGSDTGLVDTESATVTLPGGCGSTQTIAGHIYDCSAGSPTTVEVAGGMLGATGPQVVATQGNPLGPVGVVAGTYTMNAASPAGYGFVGCGGVATIISPSFNATRSPSLPMPQGDGFWILSKKILR